VRSRLFVRPGRSSLGTPWRNAVRFSLQDFSRCNGPCTNYTQPSHTASIDNPFTRTGEMAAREWEQALSIAISIAKDTRRVKQSREFSL
jgi:hypothetical protein